VNKNQEIERKLVEAYNEELRVILQNAGEAARAGKESHQRFLKKFQHQANIYEKQVLQYKSLFPTATNIQIYEAEIYLFQGILKVQTGLYYSLYPGMFSPTQNSELRTAIILFNKSLQISEQADTRSMKVFCYRQLGDNKSALRELDYIIEHHSDNEKAYLQARKEKDELETPSSPSIGGLLRSIFG
jgi:hypothetical protein